MNCIACGNLEKTNLIWETNGMFDSKIFQIEFCSCGLGKTIVTEEDFNIINHNSYDNVEDRIKIYFKNQHNHLSIRYLLALRKLKEFSSKKKLLEIGSNIGFTLNLAKVDGFDVSGCEINKKCKEFSELVYNHKVFDDYFLIMDKFDIVIMNDVLEHFINPLTAVEKLKSVLVTEGFVFIQLPNVRSKRASKLKGKWDYILAPDHTYHFTCESLDLLLKSNKFEKVWQRTATGIYDMWFIKIFPKKWQVKINALIHNNPFHFPRLYTRKKGEFIQAIYQNKNYEIKAD